MIGPLGDQTGALWSPFPLGEDRDLNFKDSITFKGMNLVVKMAIG